MPKKGHTEEQIIAALKQSAGGEKTAEICRKLSSARRHFTCGRNSMQDWAYKSCASCGNCGKRTDG